MPTIVVGIPHMLLSCLPASPYTGLSAALHVCTLLRGADRISQLALCLLGHRLYVAKRTPRGTGMGCNDLTSPVLQMRKYQTRQLQILACTCWAAPP